MSELPTEADIRAWFTTLSNWGRWGEDDVLGTLNHITADLRRSAAAAVRHGRSVSCAWDITTVASPSQAVTPQRWMVRTGLALEPDSTLAQDRCRDGSMATASEFISMVFHGRTITHLDAFSHVFWEGQMYNGVPSSKVSDATGAQHHDVRSASAGIQSRGVLLDIARYRGVQWLTPDAPIVVEDLEGCEKAQGVAVSPGDVLLIRTGDGHRRRIGADWRPEVDGHPGLHASCLPWLHERSVAALGSDGPHDVVPSGYPGIYLPIHSVGIVAMGLWLIDNCQLEDLAAACAELEQYDFLFSLLPLRVIGGTGSPANPVALL
jgi:kynurenine formamidase